MFSSKRANLLRALVLAASSLMFVIASYSISDVSAESTVLSSPLRSKILRRKDRLKLKLNADEIALLRKQGTPQEEREVEDKIPKHVPITVKILILLATARGSLTASESVQAQSRRGSRGRERTLRSSAARDSPSTKTKPRETKLRARPAATNGGR